MENDCDENEKMQLGCERFSHENTKQPHPPAVTVAT